MTKTTFDFKWFGDEVKDDVSRAGQQALLKVAADLQQRSSDQAPLKLADLRGNAGIDDSKVKNGIVFVGYSLPYALIQHERTDFAHPLGGKAKYLQDPFQANESMYERFIADAINKETT